MMEQAIELSKRPHVVIATPGRLADHIRSSQDVTHFEKVKFLVMDEADRLLDPCFYDDITCILDKLPSIHNRQTLLFSATISSYMSDLCSDLSKTRPFFIYKGSEVHDTAIHLTQTYLLVPHRLKETYLYYLLKEKWETQTIMIFVSRCKTCELLRRLFKKLDINVISLHSFMNQKARLASLTKFRTGLVNILILTDIGSRGLDIPSVQIVLNFDLPRSPIDYIHRVGRTARSGKEGMALNFVSEYDIELIQSIETKLQKRISEYEGVSESKVLSYLNKVSCSKKLIKMNMMDGQFGMKRDIQRQKKKINE
jgi:ATP-dependent RNA helicase DDX49/DBP8